MDLAIAVNTNSQGREGWGLFFRLCIPLILPLPWLYMTLEVVSKYTALAPQYYRMQLVLAKLHTRHTAGYDQSVAVRAGDCEPVVHLGSQ